MRNTWKITNPEDLQEICHEPGHSFPHDKAAPAWPRGGCSSARLGEGLQFFTEALPSNCALLCQLSPANTNTFIHMSWCSFTQLSYN